MKIARQRLPAFLKNPGRVKVVLLYGGDAGLIAERSKLLVRAVLGGADDPFRYLTISRSDQLAQESAAIALGGGRRVIRLTEAGEGAGGAVASVLDGPGDALVLLEAPGLVATRSKLLKQIEAHPDAAAIACYPDEGDELGRAVRDWLSESKVRVEGDALAWLLSRLGGDRALSRAEVEKLALYVGPGGVADQAAVEAVIGDVAGLSLDDALFAATEGDVARADRALERALASGATPIGVIRGALMHLARLQRKDGRPPVIFRRKESLARASRLWPTAALATALEDFFGGEREAKRTGVPDEVLCRHLIFSLATDGANRR